MKLHFLGGADEVGASCTLIEIEGHRILVDAGIRMGPEQDSPLPALDAVGRVDAVLITHAHSDHTSALPVLMRDLPDVKVYCTPPTKRITKVLLEDSANRGEPKEQEDKPPLYTPEEVALVLQRMEPVPWDKPVPICDGVTATWIRAGHILGAGMIYIEGERENILMTGDVSVTDQLTIPGMGMDEQLPDRPDVMVMESTYGNRLHKDRTEQENKFAQDVAKVVAAGGKVLIPAFAVGRSQEVILILKDAIERRKIPEFPVYVDGMVRDINDIYSRFPNELLPRLEHIAECGEDIFYSDTIIPVTTNCDRDNVLSGEPCCIVASSGMLNGGRSEGYAKQLVRNPKNLIAITGYQAEGTPGRALLDQAEQNDSTDREWALKKDGTKLSVKCRVKRYSLSAHADRNQLTELVQRVQPRNLFLVHGDQKARKELSESVRKTSPDVEVKRPRNGRKYTVTKQEGIAEGRRLWSDRILSELYDFLMKKGFKGPFRVRDLTEMWFGTEETTPITVQFFHWCLSLDWQFFVQDRKDSNLFRLKPIA